MRARSSRSLTRTTLYRIAAGVTVIIALATGIGYELLSREVGRRVLERLSEYVVQRAKYHGSYLTLIRDHHRVIKAELLRRYAAPMPDADKLFERLMMRYPDGAWRNRPEYLDPKRYSTGWMHKKVQPTAELRRLWMLFFDLSEQFGRLASARFVNLFFVPMPAVADMGYDNLDVVGEVHWARDTPADYPHEEEERVIAADADHDPERVTVWAAPRYDLVYKKYVVAGVTPVDVEGRHVASIGTDALMDELVASVVGSEIPGATHAIFGGDGRLIADRVHLAKVIKAERGVSIADTGDRRLLALLELVRAQATLPASGFDRESDAYYAVSRIEGPGWYFASTVPGALVRSEAFHSAQWVLWTGFASLALLLAILALILRRQIGIPLQQLLAATLQMRERKALLPLDTARPDELGRLAAAFVDTAQSIEGQFHRRAAALEAEMEERRRSEAALRESEARYHLVAQQTGHLLYDYQIPSGAIRWAGPIADLTGYTDEEFQGLGIGGWEALIHPEDCERAVAELKRAQSELRKYLLEYRLRRKDGRYIYIEDEGAFLTYGTGEAQRMLGTLKDITARKGAEEALHRAKEEADAASEAKSQFLAHMSHELRTPLNAILGYAQILERDPTLTERQRNGVTVMHRSGEHLLGLIDDILDLSKVEFQKLELQPHDFGLRDFLEGIAATFAVRAREKGLSYRQSSDPKLPPYVHGDEQRLRQVLFNLIGNAVKFTDHGEVVFTVAALGPRLRFTVADTGRGVPSEELEQIFQAFHQAAEQVRAQDGAGLGLAISRGIIELMGGTVEVASTPGQGSRFWFDIPLPSAAAPKRAQPTAAGILIGYLGPRRRILVVDDVAEGRTLLADLLEPLGFLIAEAETGQQALSVAQAFHPDAILMDLRMPVMDGYEATRRIRAIPKLIEVVIIGVSASAFGHHKARCLEAGANDFLPKPFPEQRLFELLARYLGLEWRYAPGATASAPEASVLVFPPGEVLTRLLALAERGDIKSLLDGAHTLEPDYPPFAQELRALAQGFQVKRIVRWLEGHGASGTTQSL